MRKEYRKYDALDAENEKKSRLGINTHEKVIRKGTTRN